LSNAGIDIITQDITKPWMENAAIINEVNYAPLLGGGDISRSHLPADLERIIDNDGRIPIDIFMGSGDAMVQAKAHHVALLKKGVRAYLTSHDETVDSNQSQRPYPFTSLAQRTKALLLDETVDALVLVIQNADILKSGLPIDQAILHPATKKDAFPLSAEVSTLLRSIRST
ncbi:MAG: hypothetical protein KUG61_00940, partial [Parvibaculaceae bacterium]|nr:hypothetical protein [Parvibaculaceae bacterium]